MNKLRKGLFYLAAAIAISFNTSCQKDDTLQYNNATMGNIIDGRFVSDQGNIFNVTDQQCDGKLDTMKRAFVICDVLNKTASGAANEYDVRVNHIAYVLTKNVVTDADAKDEMAVQDPVHVEYAWIAGGYINFFIMFPTKAGSTTKHLINLVHEGEMSDAQTGEPVANTFRFTLRHNSYEDKIIEDQESVYVLAGGYVSFPLNNYILAEQADFSIEWVWQDGVSAETDIKSITGTYTTDGYQHAPQISSTRAAANVR